MSETCRQCEKASRIHIEQKRQEVRDAYGVVPFDQFRRLLAELDRIEACR